MLDMRTARGEKLQVIFTAGEAKLPRAIWSEGRRTVAVLYLNENW